MKVVKHQQGLSLLEVMLALTVVSAMLVTAGQFYKSVQRTRRINDAVKIINSIYGASLVWYQVHGMFGEVDMLAEFINHGTLLPKEYLWKNANPWGGEIKAIAATGESCVKDESGACLYTQLNIELTGLNQRDCLSLREAVSHYPQYQHGGMGCYNNYETFKTFVNVEFDAHD